MVHVLRAFAGPLRPDNHLIVTQVGDRIDGHVAPRPQTRETERKRGGEREEAVANDKGEHGRPRRRRGMTNDR